MITVDKAADILLKEHPNVAIESVHPYKGDYLFVAPDKDLGLYGDYEDPFYVVNKESGEIRAITPLEDFEGFDEAFSVPELPCKRRV